MTGLKLNLGCGENKYAAYVNVDKHGNPDLVHDLETFPWPWPNDSVSEIVLCHVLEHLGHDPAVYLADR
jgi:predicted SAM-dependent methyltransferase